MLVFEDLHWADDGLLDFVDYLAEWAGGVPLLVVGTARPELLARRPGWGGGKPNTVTLSLAPLSDQDTARLIGLLRGRAVLDAGQQTMLLAQAGGNPLYAEQYVQMLAEQGAGRELPVPDSVQGIIAARLDLLAAADKRLLQDAAVIGKVFWPEAVLALGGAPGRGGLEEQPARAGAPASSSAAIGPRRSRARRSTRSRTCWCATWPTGRSRGPPGSASTPRAAGWIESLGRPDDHAEMLAHHYQSRAASGPRRGPGHRGSGVPGPGRAAGRWRSRPGPERPSCGRRVLPGGAGAVAAGRAGTAGQPAAATGNRAV